MLVTLRDIWGRKGRKNRFTKDPRRKLKKRAAESPENSEKRVSLQRVEVISGTGGTRI